MVEGAGRRRRPGSALLRFAIFFAIPVVLVVILAIVAGAAISAR